MTGSATGVMAELPELLRGEAGRTTEVWATGRRGWLSYVIWILVGGAMFGAAVGWWRAPLQAFYTAVKLPLILLLTALGNGLLNAMLAPLLGVPLNVRQSLWAVLMGFGVAAMILGALSPLLAFLVWNTPPLMEKGPSASQSHGMILLTQAAMIALAGVVSNWRLWQALRAFSGRGQSSFRLLACWLAGNLLLGSQLSWVFRPFVGSPQLEVQFLRAEAFHGSFYESIFGIVRHLLFP
jgi:hypothetical protein